MIYRPRPPTAARAARLRQHLECVTPRLRRLSYHGLDLKGIGCSTHCGGRRQLSVTLLTARHLEPYRRAVEPAASAAILLSCLESSEAYGKNFARIDRAREMFADHGQLLYLRGADRNDETSSSA